MNCNLSISIRSFLVCTLLLAGCTDRDAPGFEEAATIPLQLMVNTVSGSADTRSVVSQTGTAAGQVGAIGVCLALASDGHSAYATPEASSTLFTVSGSDVWTASRPVNLRSVQARLYAWYPADESNLATVDNGTTPLSPSPCLPRRPLTELMPPIVRRRTICTDRQALLRAMPPR